MKMYFHRCKAKMPNNILIKKSNELFNLKYIYIQNGLLKGKSQANKMPQ